MTTNPNTAPGEQLRPAPQDCTSRLFSDCSGSATLPRVPVAGAQPPSRPRHVTRHAPAARGLHQNKNRGGGTGGGACALSPPQLVRHDRAPPPGRGREGRGHHPVYRRAPALSRKRSPGSGRVSAHPPAERPCVGSEQGPRRLRVTPVTTLCYALRPQPSAPELLRTPHVAASSQTRRSERAVAADPGAPESCPHPASDVTRLGPPNPHLPPRARAGGGRWLQAVRSLQCAT